MPIQAMKKEFALEIKNKYSEYEFNEFNEVNPLYCLAKNSRFIEKLGLNTHLRIKKLHYLIQVLDFTCLFIGILLGILLSEMIAPFGYFAVISYALFQAFILSIFFEIIKDILKKPFFELIKEELLL